MRSIRNETRTKNLPNHYTIKTMTRQMGALKLAKRLITHRISAQRPSIFQETSEMKYVSFKSNRCRFKGNKKK